MRADLLLTNLRLAGFGPGHRIAVASGVVAAILPPGAAEPEAAKVLDLDGDLVLPGLVDGHMHLDKTLFGLPWMPHAAEPFRLSRIATDQRDASAFTANNQTILLRLVSRTMAGVFQRNITNAFSECSKPLSDEMRSRGVGWGLQSLRKQSRLTEVVLP